MGKEDVSRKMLFLDIPMELIIPKPNHCILFLVSSQSVLDVYGSLQLCFRSQTTNINRRDKQAYSSLLLKGRFRKTSDGHEEAKTKSSIDAVKNLKGSTLMGVMLSSLFLKGVG